jgi:hypothetical protein
MVGNVQIDGRALRSMESANRTWLADKMEYGYFLSQPSLPPCEVMVVRAAFVLQAQTRSATSLLFLATRLFPVLFSLVPLSLSDLVLRPKSDLHSAKCLDRWCFNPVFPNPAMKRI